MILVEPCFLGENPISIENNDTPFFSMPKFASVRVSVRYRNKKVNPPILIILEKMFFIFLYQVSLNPHRVRKHRTSL